MIPIVSNRNWNSKGNERNHICTCKHKEFNEVQQVCLHPQEQSNWFFFLFINNGVIVKYIIYAYIILHRIHYLYAYNITCTMGSLAPHPNPLHNPTIGDLYTLLQYLPSHKIWVMRNNLHIGKYSSSWKINSKKWCCMLL